MLRPSYNQLMKKANENFETEEPVVTSRYSIVLAAAKRARQVVDGNDTYVNVDIRKPLSVAVAELNDGKVKILPEGYVEEEPVVESEAAVGETAAENEEVAAAGNEEEVAEEAGVSEEPVSGEAEEAFAAEVTEEIEV